MFASIGKIFGKESADCESAADADLGMKLLEWGDYASANSLFQKMLGRFPDTDTVHFYLAETYRGLGQPSEAAGYYRSYLTLDPSDRYGASIKLWLLNAAPQPATLPRTYIKSLFDQYAPAFDTSLKKLHYRVPDDAYDLVMRYKKDVGSILDIGCGTGLSAAPFKKDGVAITGMDISSGMIDAARAKDIYDSLHHMDALDSSDGSIGKYDLALAEDFLIYAGDAEPVFTLAGAHLLEDGLFFVSTQDMEGDGYILGQDHRYAHSHRYMLSCAATAGMRLLKRVRLNLREEHGSIVPGSLYLFVKA